MDCYVISHNNPFFREEKRKFLITMNLGLGAKEMKEAA